MQLEATGTAIKYRRRSGEEINLRPGEPIDLPSDIAWKLIRQAKRSVRLILSPTEDWLPLWSFVAAVLEVADRLERTDPRVIKVSAATKECDAAFARDDKSMFLTAIENLVKAMQASGSETP